MNADHRLIAETLAYCEAHCDNETETETLRWITEHLSDALGRRYPRFNTGQFDAVALPIKNRELRERILAGLGLSQP